MFKIINYIFFLLIVTTFSACGGNDTEKSSSNSSENPAAEEDRIPVDPGVYINVPANTALDVPAFRVMKYEAKNDGSGNPVSKEDTTPWVEINQTEAFSACRILNSENSDNDINSDANEDGTYALISNPEWMTIARNIELVDENWTGGTVGTGCLFKGNAGEEEAGCNGSLAHYNGNNPEFGPGRNDRGIASLTLRTDDNDKEIWDLSGNVSEWVDWDMTDTLVTVTVTSEIDNRAYGSGVRLPWTQFNQLDMNVGENDEMSPMTWQTTNTYALSFTVGVYLFGRNNPGNGAAIRGGSWQSENAAGPFSLNMVSGSSKESSFGFRCVYRPKPTEPTTL